MTDNLIDLNDTDMKFDDIIPESKESNNVNAGEENEPFAKLPGVDEVQRDSSKDFMKKLRSLQNKSVLQLKKEQIQNEAPEDRRLRLLILNRYKISERFGSYLTSDLGFKLDSSSLNNLTIPELDSLINDIRFCISTKNVNSFWQDACTQGVGVAERIVSPYYNITGLSQVLSKDNNYLDVTEELVLENQQYLYCKPEYRIAYSILKNATMVHAQHQFFKTEEGKKVIEELKKNGGVPQSKLNQDETELNIKPRDVKHIEAKYRDILE